MLKDFTLHPVNYLTVNPCKICIPDLKIVLTPWKIKFLLSIGNDDASIWLKVKSKFLKRDSSHAKVERSTPLLFSHEKSSGVDLTNLACEDGTGNAFKVQYFMKNMWSLVVHVHYNLSTNINTRYIFFNYLCRLSDHYVDLSEKYHHN